MRKAAITRNTAETKISLTLNIDGKGESKIDTGCGFLDHMLELFARHGRFDLEVSCKGDMHVDAHHTTEDVAMVLGRAFSEALTDRRGMSVSSIICHGRSTHTGGSGFKGRPVLGCR